MFFCQRCIFELATITVSHRLGATHLHRIEFEWFLLFLHASFLNASFLEALRGTVQCMLHVVSGPIHVIIIINIIGPYCALGPIRP